MAKSPGIRKTIELLLKKIEALENQSFSQKLVIDELEGRLQLAEETVRRIQENPFAGLPTFQPLNIPVVNPPLPPPPPFNLHVCTGGPVDSAGNSWCTICGMHMTPAWQPYVITSGTTICSTDPASQSSTGVEEFDLDINWDDTLIK